MRSLNYYEILGIGPTAKLEAIRDAYKKLVLKIHPDRALINKDLDMKTNSKSTAASSAQDENGNVYPPNSPKKKEETTNSSDENENENSTSSNSKTQINIEFYQVQDAWKTLSNPSRRFLYDMRTFGSSTEFPECDESYLLELERAQAEKDVINMTQYLQRVLRRETKAKGLIIMDAWYGDLSVLSKFHLALGKNGIRPSCSSYSEDSLYVDVRVPLQCQVDCRSHRLIMSGGASTSRADLPGFYNPIPLSLRNKVEVGIFLRYQFNEEIHEHIANDTEAVYIPKKSHNLTALAEKFKKQDESRRKRRKEEQQIKLDPIKGNLMLFGLFSALLLIQERNNLSSLCKPLAKPLASLGGIFDSFRKPRI